MGLLFLFLLLLFIHSLIPQITDDRFGVCGSETGTREGSSPAKFPHRDMLINKSWKNDNRAGVRVALNYGLPRTPDLSLAHSGMTGPALLTSFPSRGLKTFSFT